MPLPAHRSVGFAALLALAALVAPPAARGLEAPLDALIAERWTTERGLPQNSVLALLQARDGWLWLGTFGGLARFDGSSFRVYEPASAPGLPSSRILALAEAADGALWIGTQEGALARFDGERFSTVWTRAPEPALGPIWALAEAADGAIWAGTDGGAVRRSPDGTTRVFGGAEGLPGTWVRAFHRGADGTLWAGTSDGAARLVGERFVAVSADPVSSLAQAPGDGPLIAAGERSVVELPSGRPWWRRRDHPIDSDLEGESLARVATFDRSGALWLGGEQLARRRPGRLLLDVDRGGRLGRHVRALLEDREGNLWVGTEGEGLVQARVGRIATYGRERGLPAESVLPIVEDGTGALYVGGLCGGLARLEGDRFVEVARPDGKPFSCVSALAPARDGGLWAAHRRIDKLGGDLRRRPGDALPAPDVAAAAGSLHALHEDERGRLWIGGDLGLFRLDRPAGPPAALERIASVGSEPVWMLYAEPDGALWAGLDGAIVRVDGSADGASTAATARRFPLVPPQAPRVPVRDLWRAPDGALWAATYGAGLVRLDRDGTTRAFGVDDGLAEPYVSRLLPDGHGGLWLSGNRGVYRLRVDELVAAGAARADAARLAPEAFGARDGMVPAETNGGGQPAGWRARDGRLYFPTVRGVAVIDPRADRPAAPPPPVAIEQVVLDGVAHPVTAARAGPPATVGFGVPAGTSRLEVRFTALAFTRPETVRFRYRLVGFDADWQPAGGARVASYTRLPPRAYRFEVQAASPGGPWSEAPTRLELEVAPRWSETLPVRLLAAAAVALALFAAHRLRLAHHRRRSAALSALVAERTRELASLNESLERIVAEQTDQIRETRDMAILTLAKLAEMRDGTTGEHLERIAHFSRRLALAIARGPFGSLGEDFIEELFRSSPLHDIGKVAIPDAILKKNGPLTRAEWEVMKSHTTIGGDALRRVVERSGRHSFLSMAMKIAYQHHERWDGGGYPRGLRATDAELSSRIVAVVDAYDALTSDRPYKRALPHEEALRRIAADRGRHFDPALVDAFVAAHAEFDQIRRAHPTSH